MSKTWYPIINRENCIECGACIEKCSHGVYQKGADRPEVIYPEGCIEGCHGCQNLCPAEAITYFGETGGKTSNGCGCGGSCEGGCNCS